MFKTRSVTIKPIGAKATPKAASPLPSIALIILMALVTPAAVLAAAAEAAPAPPPGLAKTPPPQKIAPTIPKAAPEKARD